MSFNESIHICNNVYFYIGIGWYIIITQLVNEAFKRCCLVPFISQVKFGNTTFKTDVCPKSLNPQWNSEWFKFEVKQPVSFSLN